MWKNVIEPHMPQMTVQHLRIARCIPKAINTHSEYVTTISFSTATMSARKRLNVTLRVHRISY